MTRRVIFLTHAEVVQDPAIPVPDWPLSAKGTARHAAWPPAQIADKISAIYASSERKAQDGATIHAEHLGLSVNTVHALHENDRSATGYLPPEPFEAHADAFFARPDASVGGWEPARHAQIRIVTALRTICDLDRSAGDILIVAHGGVGTLLRCHLSGLPITRSGDQGPGGGNYFTFAATNWGEPSAWTRI